MVYIKKHKRKLKSGKYAPVRRHFRKCKWSMQNEETRRFNKDKRKELSQVNSKIETIQKELDKINYKIISLNRNKSRSDYVIDKGDFREKIDNLLLDYTKRKETATRKLNSAKGDLKIIQVVYGD